MKSKKAIILISVFAFIFCGALFGWFNNIRYYIEKTTGEPLTFFVNPSIGVLYDDYPAYMEEIILDEKKSFLDVSSHVKIARSGNANVELYIHGSYINSNDPLVIIVNDKIIHNKRTNREITGVHVRYYIVKRFVVELSDYLVKGENTIILSTGNRTEKHTLQIR